MSQGAFTDTIYNDADGDAWNIRVQPETITTWNPVGTGTPDTDVSVKVGGSRRSYGIHARVARFRWQGTPPTGYLQNSIIRLPIFTQASYSALVKNTDYAYLGATLRLVGKSQEVIK